MGNVWDLRYEERSWFHAVTRSCKRALVQRLLLQCLHFYLCFDYFGPKCSCFTTKGIALRNEHGLQLLRRKGDVCGGQGPLSWCLWSSGATWAERAEPCEQPLATSALPARMRRTPSILQRGEHGEFQHWWQHVKQLQSLAGAQLLSGPVYCLSEKHFPNKTWKSGVLEDLHFLGRDNGAFFEI